MSTHTRHKNENGIILHDNCPRCFEHVQLEGLELDHEHYTAMWNKMLHVRFNGGEYNTEYEYILGNHMYRMYVALERHTTIDPKEMPWRSK